MSDFQGSLPVKSARDNDIKIKLVDGDSGEIASEALAISDGHAHVKIGDGTEFLAVNPDGSINVVMSEFGEIPICDYNTSAAVSKDATVNHDYIVTDEKTFRGLSFLAGARGNIKVQLGTYDGTTFTPLMIYFQQPALNISIPINSIVALGDGTLAIRAIITNLDNTSDIYSTLQGLEP
ncbi:MAG TPA: hypothetical protein DCS19_09555 [Flavobacterium sp.]|nr:hypothetical protein [Flavobacterium sp.]